MTFHLRVSIFVNFVSSGKAGRTTRSFSVKSTLDIMARLLAIMMSMIIGNTILTVVTSPPKALFKVCIRERSRSFALALRCFFTWWGRWPVSWLLPTSSSFMSSLSSVIIRNINNTCNSSPCSAPWGSYAASCTSNRAVSIFGENDQKTWREDDYG